MKDQPYRDFFSVPLWKPIACIIGIVVILLLLSSCYTRKAAERAMQKAHDRREIVSAEKCAAWYPVLPKDTITKTEWIEGQVLVHDTTVVFDTLNNTYYRTVHDRRVDTLRETHEKTVIDSAAMRAMRLQRDSAGIFAATCQAKTIKAQDRLATSERQKWITWGVLVLVLIVGGLLWFFKPKFL